MPVANDKPVYDYNIYKIDVNKVDEFVSFLNSRQFDDIPLKTSNYEANDKFQNEKQGEFKYKLMYCDKDNTRGTPWCDLLSDCTQDGLYQELKTYGAALICISDISCYVVSYGNAHFYMSGYCDFDFGINIAERLLNLDSVKAQQNVSHGSNVNKQYIDYYNKATLSYRGGEIPTYIRGESVDEEKWGKIINCGVSVQFKWPEKPLEIGRKLAMIDKVLQAPSKESIPRLIALDNERDSEQIDKLFYNLAKSIDEYDESKGGGALVSMPSFYIVGTKLIQNESLRYKFICRIKSEPYYGDVSITSLKEFVVAKQIDIYQNISKIKISVERDNEVWNTGKPLIDYLEFVTEDNFCLRNGKWCKFNNSYMEQVFRDANRVEFNNHTSDNWLFDKNALIYYAKKKGIYEDKEHQQFETYYNHKICEILGGNIIHPETIELDDSASGKYKYEVCDFTVNDCMYFVKIGSPTSFAYAVDQAMLTVSKIQNGHGKVVLPSVKKFEPKHFILVLVCDKRSNIIEKWKDVGSVNFLIHLSELKRTLDNMSISLQVEFAYSSSTVDKTKK